jgi:glycosyltransferase involved in cell wall biosynthesis
MAPEMNAFEHARWRALNFIRTQRARPRWYHRPSSPGTPRVTVMMPAYNSQETLRDAVESVLAQTVGDLELLVVDDASPVPATDSLRDLDDPRVGVVRHGRNRNTCGARNTALALARAPLVSQLDADDAWKPTYLESILPCFDDPRVGLAYSNATIVGHPDGHDDYIGDASVHPMDRFPKFAEQNPIPALTATIRTDAARAVGGYAEWLWAATDYYLYAKLIAAGWSFRYVDRQLTRYHWPSAASKSAHARRVERAELGMWLGFVARHPRTPGPRRQVRVRLKRELQRALASG